MVKITLQDLYANVDLLKGKITEINGTHDSGKSNYALWLCQAFQKNSDCIVFYLDNDNKVSELWAASHRLDMKRFFLSFQIEPDKLESTLRIAKAADVFVIDSLATYKGNIYRLMAKVAALNLTVIIVNQLRADLDSHQYGALRKYYGNLMERYCSVYIDSNSGTVEIKQKKLLLPYEDDNIYTLSQFVLNKEKIRADIV